MFDEHFEIFLADTEESKTIGYSIRYQVYCEEMGFEDKNNFPLEQERDEYDSEATHFIVRHKKTKTWVGAMRLIHKKDKILPIEQNAKLNKRAGNINSGYSVELSRLCVIKEMRRGSKDIDPPNNIPPENDVITQTNNINLLHKQHILSRKIVWGLLHSASIYCYHHNINNWYFLTTHALAKILRKGGLILFSIGEACSHKGERYPFKMDVAETYHSKAWNNEYKRGYNLFSLSEQFQLSKQAA